MKIAFTGHRPDKLGNRHNEVYAAIHGYVFSNDIEYAFCGMARGVDMLAAATCASLDIPFEACVPFIGQAATYTDKEREQYLKLCERAKHVHVVCDGDYKPWFFQLRNEYMVDNCDVLVAVWDGSAGGTKNCIDYANKIGRKVEYLKWR